MSARGGAGEIRGKIERVPLGGFFEQPNKKCVEIQTGSPRGSILLRSGPDCLLFWCQCGRCDTADGRAGRDKSLAYEIKASTKYPAWNNFEMRGVCELHGFRKRSEGGLMDIAKVSDVAVSSVHALMDDRDD